MFEETVRDHATNDKKERLIRRKGNTSNFRYTGLDYKAVLRLRECCRQVEAEVVRLGGQLKGLGCVNAAFKIWQKR